MLKFFVDEVDGSEVTITGLDARHIGLSLRMQVGDPLTVSAYGIDYACQITSITPKEVRLTVLSSLPSVAESSISVTLYQAVPKADKLVHIIQKAVELGAVRIVPILTQNCISRPNAVDFDRKLFRLQKIAKAAAKQSGHGIIPQVTKLITIDEMCKELQLNSCNLLLYENGGKHFSEISLEGKTDISIIVGSEGGFTQDEAQQIQEAGAERIWLGNRILRCETAPVTALSVLMHMTGNL